MIILIRGSVIMADGKYTSEEIKRYIDSLNHKKEKKATHKISIDHENDLYYSNFDKFNKTMKFMDIFTISDEKKEDCSLVAAITSFPIGTIFCATFLKNIGIPIFFKILMVPVSWYCAYIGIYAALEFVVIITNIIHKINDRIQDKKIKKKEKKRLLNYQKQIEKKKKQETEKNKEISDDVEEYIKMISESVIAASELKYEGFQKDINRLYKLAQIYMNMREANPNKSSADIVRENPKLLQAINEIESIINSHKKTRDSLAVEKQMLIELSKLIPQEDLGYTDELTETDFTSGEATMELPKLKR